MNRSAPYKHDFTTFNHLHLPYPLNSPPPEPLVPSGE